MNVSTVYTSLPSKSGAMTFRTLVSFLALTFGLTWGLGAIVLLFPAQIEAISGPIRSTNPCSSWPCTHRASPVYS